MTLSEWAAPPVVGLAVVRVLWGRLIGVTGSAVLTQGSSWYKVACVEVIASRAEPSVPPEGKPP